MESAYRCDNLRRIELVRNHPTLALNGIDFLEVLDRESPEEEMRQRTLLVRTLRPLPAPPNELTEINVRIEGGVRVSGIKPEWVARAGDANTLFLNGRITEDERDYFLDLELPGHVLVIRTDAAGDFSTYTLRLVQSDTDDSPPDDFDLLLSSVDFSFKVECPSDFDCADETFCPTESDEAPEIDYLAKDYTSFRQLMFDRLSVVMPEWTERNPADIGVAIVELLAYTGDYLSYYQDAVATEAYLGTARRRVSVRRHARLLDYPMHDGCNARVWLSFAADAIADGFEVERGTPFSTLPTRAGEAPIVFETLAPITLRARHSEILFHTWGDFECCLPIGSTSAALVDDGLTLRVGDVLIFEEVLGPKKGDPADADPGHRHAVRLTRVEPITDDVVGTDVLLIEWSESDALPFPLCISAVVPDTDSAARTVSVARGNVVLADHGLSVEGADLYPDKVPKEKWVRQRLDIGDITMCEKYEDELARARPASEATRHDPRAALPDVRLVAAGEEWTPQRDLFGSDRFSPHFVLEVENDGTSWIRFGDDLLGKRPSPGTEFSAFYRLGNGSKGNVGRNSITQVPAGMVDGVAVTNPLPGVGGTDPESMEEVRQYAPQAFRTQQRAVTEEDYVRVAELHPEVQKAAARFRWTGSWYTVFVTIDRQGGAPVDDDPLFEREMRSWLNRFRLAGYDIEITGPIFIPLDLAMEVCVKPGYFRSEVQRELLRVFSRFDLPGGDRGFFHPDNFTFGQPLYLSLIYERAMRVEGVASVNVTRFQRWGKKKAKEIETGVLTTAALEIVRLDNDPSAPENGVLNFSISGGL